MRRYLIVGMGAAGIAAAQAIRSRDPHAKIVLVSEERDGYYSRPGLAYYLTGELPEKLLHPFTGADFRRESLRRIHARAAQVSPKEHIVTLEDGQRVSYDRLLIAVGASAFRPPIPGGDLNGVVKLDTLDDAREIIKIARWGRAAVVVGGGITALEIVEGLHTRGARTHYFLRRDRYWGNVLDETESRIVEHRLREEGVRIHYRTELEKIMGKRGRVVGVWTKDGRQIKCRIVAIAIGVRPRLELAKSAGLRCERGILVNKFMESSAADIFAAGDVAQVFDPLTGAHAIDSLWWVARNQGRAAGLNMTGMQIPYRKQVPFNVTRLAGLTTTIIGTVGRGVDKDLVGIARGDSETWRQLPDSIAAQSGFDVNRLRIIIGNNTLIGAIVMGDQTLSQPIQELVSKQVNISAIRDSLINPNGQNIADIVADFYTQWKMEHAVQ